MKYFKSLFILLGILLLLVSCKELNKNNSENSELNSESYSNFEGSQYKKSVETTPLNEIETDKKFVYGVIKTKIPKLQSGGYDKKNPVTGYFEYEHYCELYMEVEFFTFDVIELDNSSKAEQYKLIDAMRSRVRQSLHANDLNFSNELIGCPTLTIELYESGAYDSEIVEVEIYPFETYEAAWENKELQNDIRSSQP